MGRKAMEKEAGGIKMQMEDAMTTFGDPGDIENTKLYLVKYGMSLDRAQEILNHIVDSGAFNDDAQIAMITGIRAIERMKK